MPRAAMREDLRQTILDVADRLFAHYGYKKTTIDDIAREARIGKGTVYLYFKSKEEIALCMADRITERVMAHLMAIAKSADSPANRVRRMIAGRILFRFDSIQQFSRCLDEIFAALRPAFIARRERWLDAEAGIIAEVLVEGELLGTFQVEEAIVTARAIILATNGLMPSNLTAHELGEREEVRQKVERIADLLMNGILRRTPARL